MLDVEKGGLATCIYRDQSKLLQTGLTRYFNERLFSDITIIGPDGRKLYCHQLVVAASSTCFRRVLENGPLQDPELPVLGVDSAALESVLQFFYSGECRITIGSVVALLDAAQRLEVAGLADACEEYITEVLQPSTCCSLLAQAQAYNMDDLCAQCLRLAQLRFHAVVLTDDFSQAPFSVLSAILQHCRTTVSSADLFRAAWNWALCDLLHMKHLLDVAKLVSLPPHLTLNQLFELEPISASQRAAREKLTTPGQPRVHLEALALKVWPSLGSNSGHAGDGLVTVDGSKALVLGGKPSQELSSMAGSPTVTRHQHQGANGMLLNVLQMPGNGFNSGVSTVNNGGGGGGGTTLSTNNGVLFDVDSLVQFAYGMMSGMSAEEALAASNMPKNQRDLLLQQQASKNAAISLDSQTPSELLMQLAASAGSVAQQQQQQQQQQQLLGSGHLQQQQQQPHRNDICGVMDTNIRMKAPSTSSGGSSDRSHNYSLPAWTADVEQQQGTLNLNESNRQQVQQQQQQQQQMMQQQQVQQQHHQNNSLIHVMPMCLADLQQPQQARSYMPFPHSEGINGSLSNNTSYNLTGSGVVSCLGSAPMPAALSAVQPFTIGVDDNLGMVQGGMLMPTLTTRKKKSRTRSRMCQLDGCNADLTGLRDYHLSRRICEYHFKASSIVKDGIEQRFCQQCGYFHALAAFDGAKRSCRQRLALLNERRRKRPEKPWAPVPWQQQQQQHAGGDNHDDGAGDDLVLHGSPEALDNQSPPSRCGEEGGGSPGRPSPHGSAGDTGCGGGNMGGSAHTHGGKTWGLQMLAEIAHQDGSETDTEHTKRGGAEANVEAQRNNALLEQMAPLGRGVAGAAAVSVSHTQLKKQRVHSPSPAASKPQLVE